MTRFYRLLAGYLLAGWVSGVPAATFDVRIPSEFNRIVDTNQVLRTLTNNSSYLGWIEGPVWIPQQGGYLVFSDQTNKRMYRWSAAAGLTLFRSPSNNGNGNTLDLNERLITCETDTRRVVRTETNGLSTVLVDAYNQKTFNAPNDVVVKSDGTVWFSDPNYGLGQTQPGRYVYRFHPTNGNATVTAVATSFTQPNGLCFSPDETRLYIADSDNSTHYIRVLDVLPNNTLANNRLFATITNGVPDGIRCDVEGRVYSSAAEGVWIFLPDGRLAGKILLPNTVANLCFGDSDDRTLYVVAQPGLYSIRLKVAGTPSIKKLSWNINPGRLDLSWPAPSTGFQLETAVGLDPGTPWTSVGQVPVVVNWMNMVSLPPTNPTTYFRLKL